jgi:hypothetical protein
LWFVEKIGGNISEAEAMQGRKKEIYTVLKKPQKINQPIQLQAHTTLPSKQTNRRWIDECREQPLHEAGKLALRTIQRDDAVDGASSKSAL